MMLFCSFILLICGLSQVNCQDPADSWLAYTIAPGSGQRVTRVNVTWQVMAYPTISKFLLDLFYFCIFCL